MMAISTYLLSKLISVVVTKIEQPMKDLLNAWQLNAFSRHHLISVASDWYI
jgi:hypothetical protein